MAYADLIRADAIAAIGAALPSGVLERMDVLVGALGAAMLIAAWCQRKNLHG